MAEPSGEKPGTSPTLPAREESIGMGLAIASLIVFLIVAVGAFWAINGNALTAATSSPAIAAEAKPTEPRQPEAANQTKLDHER